LHLSQVDDVEHALEDVRDVLRSQHPNTDAWQSEFTAIVQDVVRQDAGWSWHGFWQMIEYNLAHPPCSAAYRESDVLVHALVRELLERFAQRPEVPFLDASTLTCRRRVAEWMNRSAR